jgi:hypothetical protein
MSRLAAVILLLGTIFSASAQELDKPADFVVPITIVLDLDNPNRIEKLGDELRNTLTQMRAARTASEIEELKERRRAIKLEITRLRSLVAKQ